MRTLRPYQTEALQAARRDILEGGKASTLIVLPTGTGKTVLFSKLASEWERGNVLVLAHRAELLWQAQKKIGDELGYVPVVEKAQLGMDIDCLWQGGSVLVGSVQTMIGDKRLEKFRQHPFDLIVIDEAHHATSASYQKVINYFRELNPACKVVGVTATPNRADEAALGIVFESCAYELEILTAIEEGWLVPIKQEIVMVDGLNLDDVAINRSGSEKGDFKAADLEAVLIEEKPLHRMAEPVVEKCGTGRTLIFTAGVAHAHMFASILNRWKPGSAAAADGNTLPEEREEIVKRFADGEIQFLCNCNLFTEGFDVPPTENVVMGRPTKSVGLYTQMLGRGMRPLDGLVDAFGSADERREAIFKSDKPCMFVLDFVGNSNHKLVSSADILGGNYDVEVRELAKRDMVGRAMDPTKALQKAQARMLLQKEEEARRKLLVKAEYRTQEVDPFGHGPAYGQERVEKSRGGSTDAQIAFLVNLGVSRETAARYGKKQAGAVIDKLTSERCTKKQRAILERHGKNPNVNFEQAKVLIDEIARSGWQAPVVSH